jgi:protein-disulfide isomerase
MAHAKFRTALLASFTAVALAACGGAGSGDAVKEQDVLNKVTAPAGKSWSDVAAVTADGGLLIGNPEAPIKVIEFASLTCSACAKFSADSGEELKTDFIDSGRVSFELRHFLLNQIDLLAANVVQCAAPERQYALAANLFASQEEIFAGANAGMQGAQAAMANQADPARFVKAADAIGLTDIFQARGIPADAVNSCLSNVAAVESLVARNNSWNEQYQIQGTPTFVVNGQSAGSLNWAGLRDQLRTMGAR